MNTQLEDTVKVDVLVELASMLSSTGSSDSAEVLLKSARELTNSYEIPKKKALISIRLGNIYLSKGDFASSENEFKNAISILKKSEIKKNLDVAYKNLAIVYAYQGIFEKAIFNFNKTIEIAIEAGDTLQVADGYNSIGLVYLQKSNLSIALNYFHKSLSLYEKTDSESDISYLYNNLGKIYTELLDYKKAIEYFKRNLTLAEKNNVSANKAMALHNISICYGNLLDYKNAYKYAIKALKAREEAKRSEGDYVNTLNQIGDIYFKVKSFSSDSIAEIIFDKPYFSSNPQSLVDSALALYLTSYNLIENTDFAEQKANTLFYIAEIEKYKGRFLDALSSFKEALKIQESLDVEYDDQAETCLNIYEVYEKLNQKDSSLKYYILYHEKYAQAFNHETQMKLGAEMASYSLNRQHEIEQEKQQQELQLSIEREKNAKLKLYFALGAGLLVLILLIYILKSLNEKKKANQVLALQKAQIEEKNSEITSSINYARHLQNAIQPKKEYIAEYFSDSFQIYKPKDIVAGDFIWFKDSEQNTKVVFGVGDCTGHGVPGAMVSVACSTALDRSVTEFGLTKPSLILDKSTEIITSFFGSNENVKDGMDIALCKIDIDTNKLEFSGANNPLFIIRNEEIIVLPSTRQTVGYVTNPIPFENHEIQLEKGDLIYLFSDGYIDQFGGSKNKKLKTSGFKDLLLKISSLPMAEQEKKMLEFFDRWKGTHEQIDDVCIFGIRI